MLPWQPNNHDNQFQHARLSNSEIVQEQTLNHLSIMNINKATGQGNEISKIMTIFYSFSCYHGNQITMTTNFNILGGKIPRVFKNKL